MSIIVLLQEGANGESDRRNAAAPHKGLVKLEEGSVSGVGIREQHGIRKILAQPIRIRHRNHSS